MRGGTVRWVSAALLLAAALLTGCRFRHTEEQGAEPVALPDELRAAERAFALGQRATALDRYVLYLETNPGSRWADHILCRIGQCYLAEGGLSRAEQFFRRALEYDPGPVVRNRARVGIGDVEFRRKKYAAAFRAYWKAWDAVNEVVRTGVPEPHVLFHLGKCCWALDHPLWADHYFDLLLERYPKSPYCATAAELHRPIYEVHAGELPDREKAEARARQVRARNFNVEIIAFERSGTFWLRVRVGIYRTRQQAERIVAEMGRTNLPGYIIRGEY